MDPETGEIHGSNNAMNKYCIDTRKSIVDNKTVLDPEDDAATANWGGSWRMPTIDEFTTFIGKCACEWIKDEGAYATNNEYSSKSIFLPIGGYYSQKTQSSKNLFYYWSSSLDSNKLYSYRACGLSINSTTKSFLKDEYNRCRGLAVRAVCL